MGTSKRRSARPYQRGGFQEQSASKTEASGRGNKETSRAIGSLSKPLICFHYQ